MRRPVEGVRAVFPLSPAGHRRPLQLRHLRKITHIQMPDPQRIVFFVRDCVNELRKPVGAREAGVVIHVIRRDFNQALICLHQRQHVFLCQTIHDLVQYFSRQVRDEDFLRWLWGSYRLVVGYLAARALAPFKPSLVILLSPAAAVLVVIVQRAVVGW